MEVMALMKGSVANVPNFHKRFQSFVKSYNLNNYAIMIEVEKFLEDNLFVPDELIELLDEFDPSSTVQTNFKEKLPAVLDLIADHQGSDE